MPSNVINPFWIVWPNRNASLGCNAIELSQSLINNHRTRNTSFLCIIEYRIQFSFRIN